MTLDIFKKLVSFSDSKLPKYGGIMYVGGPAEFKNSNKIPVLVSIKQSTTTEKVTKLKPRNIEVLNLVVALMF